ncbi:MAG: hypothetical protein KAQ98_09155 [Bacteriovoracaceae bacterium]|nr:hypothetical protein [Bacteriovoracaceae bacterium]
MDTRITALYPIGCSWARTNIFGYASKGIPGLEIVGLGKNGKTIKEKFIFITRREKLRLPLKRYVICIEEFSTEKDIMLSNLRWIELPMLVLFWSMAGLLPIGRLDDCLAAGKIQVDGMIDCPIITDDVVHKTLGVQNISEWKMIAPDAVSENTSIPVISLEDIFRERVSLSVQLVPPSEKNRFIKEDRCFKAVPSRVI